MARRFIVGICVALLPACSPCWDRKNDEEIAQCMRELPTEDILKYPQVASYLRDHKVYVSLTTSPKRIFEVHKVLDTLDQTHVETIFLAFPNLYRNKEPHVIPDGLVK